MEQTLKQRLHELEKKVNDLLIQQAASGSGKRSWQRTFGLSRNDPGFHEMVELGQDYRRKLSDQGNGAGS